MESDSFDEENNVEFDAKETDSEEDDEGAKRIDTKISVASSNFGAKDEENEVKRGAALKWVQDVEFTSMVDFMDSPQYQDLMDNFNMDSKKINKKGDTTRNWVCKFSKKKKGFNCPVKSRTVQTIEKVTVFKVEEASHEHEPVENSTRKNFDFSVEAQSKMKELLPLNVNSRNIRKALIDKGIYTEETAPSIQGFYNKTSQLRKKMNLDRSA